MYKVFLNGNTPLHENGLSVYSGEIHLKENNAGSFKFEIYSDHPQYGNLEELTSIITVLDESEELFCGRITEIKRNIFNTKTVYCEGELAFFNDSIQRPAKIQGGTVKQYLEMLVSKHNAEVANDKIDKTFRVGSVTVTDPNNYVYKTTNYDSTLEVISEDLLKTYGGHLRIRKVNGVRYLDYLKDYPNTNTQIIQFGENLANFSEDLNTSEIATVLIPLGAITEEKNEAGLQGRVDITSVNDGKDYVINQTAIDHYGKITKKVTWDDVTQPQNLKNKANEYLTDTQFADITLEVSAVDLHMLDVNIERIKILDEIRVVSEPNGMDRFFPVTDMTIYMDAPSQNTLRLGDSTKKTTFTSIVSGSSASNKKLFDTIPNELSILKEALENASKLIKSATNGHVVLTEGAEELLIMDTDDIKTARKVWRWNLNGLGYSSTGYNGQYELAITMDGQIAGKFLVANSIIGDKLSVEYKQSLTDEINQAKKDAEETSEGYTDTKLLDYMTSGQVTSAIETSAGQVLIDAQKSAEGYVNGKLKDYSTSAQIKVTTDAIQSQVNSKYGQTETQSLIDQNADSIRLKANKIAWTSEKSSMTEEGVLTCNGANVNGEIHSKEPFNGTYKHTEIKNGIVKGYLGEDQTGFIDFSAWYGEGQGGNLVVNATHFLRLQAELGIYFENYTKFFNTVTFGNKVDIEGVTTFKADSTFDRDATFNTNVFHGINTTTTLGKIITSNIATFNDHVYFNGHVDVGSGEGDNRYPLSVYNPLKLFNLEHVTSGGHVVLASDGAKCAYLASSSKRYKDPVGEITAEDAEKILDIPVVKFKYKEDYLSKDDRMYGKPMVGFYAEDLDEVCPEAVVYDKDGRPEDWNHRTLIPLMLKMIQEQQKEIDELKKKINS